MDLVEIVKRISQLKVGQTINSEGEIQDCQNWSTSISRRYYGDSHDKTCKYLVGKTNEIIAHIESYQEDRDKLIALLPDFDLALSTYIETCRNKRYFKDVENTLIPTKLAIRNILIKIDADQRYQERLKSDAAASTSVTASYIPPPNVVTTNQKN